MNNPIERRRVQIANQLEAFNKQCESEGIQLSQRTITSLFNDMKQESDSDSKE